MTEPDRDATDRHLELLQRYWPLMEAEYERIGALEEYSRYFTGSGGDFTENDCERWLARLKEIPSAVGFDGYCAHVGLDAEDIRRSYEELSQPTDL